MDSPKQNVVRDAWWIAKSYWISQEKRSAWGLLVAVVALNLGNVYISVRINEWNNAFYNALQKFDGGEFQRTVPLQAHRSPHDLLDGQALHQNRKDDQHIGCRQYQLAL